MTTALASGLLLGLAAGLSPGPMLVLVLTQTLRHGVKDGCKIALIPLITDPPIILIALGLATRLVELRPWLGVVSMAGAVFVLYLAWETSRPLNPGSESAPGQPGSWTKGIVTNLLNPHPWIFWLTVGAAVLAKALAQSWMVAAAFLFGFYLLLVGAKVAIALLANRSRNLLTGRLYRTTMRALAFLLVFFAVLLFREGLRQMAEF